MQFKTLSRRGTAVPSLTISLMAATAALALPAYDDWVSPAPIEKLPASSTALNTPAVDGCVSLSRDGRAIYFNSNRTGNHDIYVATREDTESGFGNPERMPDTINTGMDEACPTIANGNRLYFHRRSATDLANIWVSKWGPNGWGEAEELGGEINTAGMEESVDFYDDEDGRRVTVFSRRNPDGSGGRLMMSVDGATAVPLDGPVNSVGANNRPTVTRDGRTIYFDSTRPGGVGAQDIYVATRSSTSEPFGTPFNLTALNSPQFDARPAISFDESELYFSSARAGSESAQPDIWRTARDRSSNGPKVVKF